MELFSLSTVEPLFFLATEDLTGLTNKKESMIKKYDGIICFLFYGGFYGEIGVFVFLFYFCFCFRFFINSFFCTYITKYYMIAIYFLLHRQYNRNYDSCTSNRYYYFWLSCTTSCYCLVSTIISV